MGCSASVSGVCGQFLRLGGANPLRAVLRGHEGSINAMAISLDGSLLATASEDGSCRVWNTKTFSLQCVLYGHSQYVSCIAMSGEHLVTASADKTIIKWDVLTGRCECVLAGHQSVINGILIHQGFIFSTSYDKTARQWDLVTGECLQQYAGHERGVNPLIMVDLGLQDMRPTRRVSRTRLHSIQNSPSGSSSTSRSVPRCSHRFLLITGSADSTARAWPMDSPVSTMVYKGHGSAVQCLAARDKHRELYTGSSDGTIRSWDIQSGQILNVFDRHQGAIVCLQVSSCKRASTMPISTYIEQQPCSDDVWAASHAGGVLWVIFTCACEDMVFLLIHWPSHSSLNY